MSESKHTLAPWIFKPITGRDIAGPQFEVSSADMTAGSAGDYVATVYDERDVRLIAAAPKMLAALRSVRQELWVNYCLGRNRTDPDPAFNNKPHIRIIDAALAEATGSAT